MEPAEESYLLKRLRSAIAEPLGRMEWMVVVVQVVVTVEMEAPHPRPTTVEGEGEVEQAELVELVELVEQFILVYQISP